MNLNSWHMDLCLHSEIFLTGKEDQPLSMFHVMSKASSKLPRVGKFLRSHMNRVYD